MTKKGTLNMKRIVYFALAMVLGMSLVLPAFADPVSVAKSEAEPAKAALTKIFQMPGGTNTPDIAFTFEFEPEAFDYNEANKSKLPPIPSFNVNFSEADNAKIGGDVKTYIKETEILKDIDWPEEGVYTYSVTEKKDTYKLGTIDEFEEKLIYSPAKYDIEVYVAQGEQGLYILAIAAYIVINDDSNKDEEVGEKVDPTPGGDPSIEGDYSKMIFTNTYVKNNGTPEITDPEDPEDPEVIDDYAVFKVTKTVDDKGDKDKPFSFKAKVNVPAIGVDPAEQVEYMAYLVKKDAAGKLVVTEKPFKLNDEESFELKHGEYLAFTDMHVGASFNVTEEGTPNYTPSYTFVKDSKPVDNDKAAKGEPLSTGLRRIGETKNSADYLNTAGLTIPTGISVDNLPYIVLIIASLFALVGYIAIKTRMNAKTNA